MTEREPAERVERVERRATSGEPVERVERVQRVRQVQPPAAAGPTNVNVSPAAPAPPTNVNVAPATAGYGARYPAAREPAWAVAKANQVLWFVCGVLEALLALRFILLLIGANPGTPFAAFIYRLTQPLVWPFQGLVGSAGARGGPVFDANTLVAMLVYFLFFLLLTQLLRLLVSRPPPEV